MKKILYKIKGNEYLLVSILITPKNSENVNQKLKKCDAIERGVTEVHPGGIFRSGYVIYEALIPINKIKLWNKN